MTLAEVMAELESRGNEAQRRQSIRRGAGENQFGVLLGELRVIAKKIGTNTALARELWATGNEDARLLALLIVKPKDLTRDELEAMVHQATYAQLADWLNSYVVKSHPDRDALREVWMRSDDPGCARSGWSLTADRIAKGGHDLDLPALMDRIEAEMGNAHPLPQWTMNFALAMIGIHHPELRERALAIGEKLGVYRDYPVSKGCTSPFAPIWIGEMVRRQG